MLTNKVHNCKCASQVILGCKIELIPPQRALAMMSCIGRPIDLRSSVSRIVDD